jgi:predicted O-linked N-acetylglucosamine transferase (SPINDLY family)
VQDVFDPSGAPVDAVRIHPAALQRLARLGAELRGASQVERLLLRRESGVRRLVNAPEIEADLVSRDFTVMNFANMPFAEQVRAAAGAEVIVGQSGAQLANMVFARPGTRIFPLYSDTPGTNYYLWSVIGAALGLEVINVAGWRLVGSATGNAPVVHENFTLPPGLLAPFFPKPVNRAVVPVRLGRAATSERLAEAEQGLSRLYGCNADADVLTGAWAVLAGPTPAGFDDRITLLRRNLRPLLLDLDEKSIQQLLAHPFFVDYGRNLRSGFSALADFDEAETETIAEILHLLGVETRPAEDADEEDEEEVSPGGTGDGAKAEGQAKAGDKPPSRAQTPQPARVAEQADFARTLALAMLYLPAWRAPLVADLQAVPAALRGRYLDWITAPPFLFRAGEDAGFAGHVVRLLDWMADHLDPARPAEIRKAVAQRAANLDLGTLLLIDEPLEAVRSARNRVLERIALRGGGTPRKAVRPADGSEGRRRIGILCRTFDKGPDSEAVVSYFTAADRTKYEVFAYSIGFQDRVVTRDEDFDREFDASIDHRRLLPSDPWDIREQLIADQLDVFLYANATTFGVRDLDLALYHRVAPVQAVMNSHIPLALGYPSFDAIITGQSDDPDHEVDAADQPERLVRVPGPVICYLNSLKPRPAPAFDRAALGLGKDEIVLFNAGSLSKLRHDCLATMMRAAKQAPGARLLLAPYNPGWVARSQALAFNRQLHETAEEVGLDPARITVMGELSVAEAEAALALSDLYLAPFPHGGATMTHLALIYGVPPVVLRRHSTRSIDQFLVDTLGMRELLVSTPDDYVARVVELATDTGARRALATAMKEAARKPAFVANPDYSLAMMAAVETLLPRGI